LTDRTNINLPSFSPVVTGRIRNCCINLTFWLWIFSVWCVEKSNKADKIISGDVFHKNCISTFIKYWFFRNQCLHIWPSSSPQMCRSVHFWALWYRSSLSLFLGWKYVLLSKYTHTQNSLSLYNFSKYQVLKWGDLFMLY
jgi:hypothetical protein